MAADDVDPGLPIKLHPCSNGEYLPPPASPLVREVARRTRERAASNAHAVGMSRRQFLLSSMGAATMLTVLAACSREAEEGEPGGTFVTSPEAERDPDAARDALGGDDFVFDVQGHFLDYSHDYGGPVPAFPQSNCGSADPKECYSVERFLDLIFNKSDTNMIVLSALPFAGNPLSPEVMARTIALADEVCGDQRVLMQGEAHPSDGPLDVALAAMADLRDRYGIGAWKVYTHAGGPGWYLDDHDPRAAQVGERFLSQVATLGPPIVAVHKGFSSGSPFASPVDVGPAALNHPELSFVVYHSGYEAEHTEGPYDADAPQGIDRLIASVRAADIGPGGNVYAELGSTWKSVMGRPTEAAHVLGKLLAAFGEDNVVWGTDSIWYGSPQDQIQAFRAFQISEQFQERFGYPALTPQIKAKILGLNSARLYGVEPITSRCRIDRGEIEQARQASTDGNQTFGPTTAAGALALMRAHRIATA
ncbi:amidohydrolase family protein [Rhabdothermincola sediminis]|uniref:amidohydrolase family protein n=1 Tax=Rhabdothermincola sediminis TaxID=2751370 RepID=UPI001AA02AA4|nr:amidohydrolase family protein [Rhabdothermincola sediminis]